MASTWWTAHIAASALASLSGAASFYLIQEYEPFTFPMGTYAALATDSYRLPHFGLFSSELLRDYFRRHGIGVFAEGTAAGDAASASFENAITPVDPPSGPISPGARPAGSSLRPARAARGPQHVRARRAGPWPCGGEGRLRVGWERGIGTVEERSASSWVGAPYSSCCRVREQGGYAELLREHDVGLALMYTPHPSLVPIEMASAGMLTVTNSFENKTAEAMSAISSNLITAEPTWTASPTGWSRPRTGWGVRRAPPAAGAGAAAGRSRSGSTDGTHRVVSRGLTGEA